MREMRTESISNAAWRRRGLRLGTIATGSLGLVALVALLLPMTASGAPLTVVQTITITAPYTGATTSSGSSMSVAGCGASSVVTPAFFHGRTGEFGFSGAGSSHACATSSSDYSSSYGSVSVEIPLVVLSGLNHITASWSIQFDAANSFHAGTCTFPSGNTTGNNSSSSGCYAETSATMYATAQVVDATNGSTFLPVGNNSWPGFGSGFGTGSGFSAYCFSGSCSSYSWGAPGTVSFHGPALWHFRAPGLVTSHSYFLAFSITGNVFMDEWTYGGATLTHTHSSAWLNFGTFGNGAKLTSVVIT